ncbi:MULTISPECIES: hypothetical protein [Pseudoalteromonas]|uniref:Uncharacterized protein n=1 Tax=Pseudoalteromonas ruthenica TaxID=151081 RepID=A0A0F4Q2F0_9GAMM|nr:MULTISPECIES: hypothetical protein [Pseudoalteromonas]KJY97869.1 hypothetical protein TW76_08630 [Pseudoalteromonas ruthenica]KJZ01896.1 hypothetical protein TW72_02845 [Pseudoalteromonas ruthenica]MCF2862789.1 hypothetical protein [Pseudoalteromonas sp. CNAT2-18]MCG7543377.1 hypothetical protein [Pseudoalteromonas sp. MM17-2]MCG7558759.1 hypothetical protein [Pseudoalteromonas sp. CNAT2-18.1]|tara:strand:- start:3577 stop:3774 length:198 start_codon:yes stop_codon:yes gene_type:complete
MFNHSATKAFIATLFAAVFAMGCEDSGGAEEAGEKIDEAITDTQNAVEDACENVKENAGAEETNC